MSTVPTRPPTNSPPHDPKTFQRTHPPTQLDLPQLRLYFDNLYRIDLVHARLKTLIDTHDLDVSEMFGLVDEDDSGEIGLEELHKLVSKLGIVMKKIDVGCLMDSIDLTGNGN